MYSEQENMYCENCNTIFQNEFNLMSHIRLSHDEEPISNNLAQLDGNDSVSNLSSLNSSQLSSEFSSINDVFNDDLNSILETSSTVTSLSAAQSSQVSDSCAPGIPAWYDHPSNDRTRLPPVRILVQCT